jgi:hypothetical protein
MVKEVEGVVKKLSKNTTFIYLPSSLVLDSCFPFKMNDKVVIRIDGERLVVEKLKEEKLKEVNYEEGV